VRLFGRPSKDEADDVRWLEPTRVRQRPRRRLPLFGFLTAAVIVAGALVVASVRLSGPAGETSRPQPPPPAPREQAQAPVVPTPAQPPRAPDVQPTPDPPPAQLEARAPDQPPAAEPDADPAPTNSIAGAFPPGAPPASDDPEAPEFAAYLNESAPDQTAARTLVIDAQRRYAGALDGGRLSYKRVRLGDGSTVWRLRLSGLTRAAAERICASLAAAGEGCEVGPR
jgi:outer membrane biosynthesis protein TonB